MSPGEAGADDDDDYVILKTGTHSDSSCSRLGCRFSIAHFSSAAERVIPESFFTDAAG